MSEHAWVLENLAADAAGGLAAAERERLERHLADCPDCARAAEGARAADRDLLALFAADRPDPALEDRMIRTLRGAISRRRPFHWPGGFRAVLAVAAAALLAVVGAGVAAMLDPAEPVSMAANEPGARAMLGRLAGAHTRDGKNWSETLEELRGDLPDGGKEKDKATNGVLLLPEEQAKRLQHNPYMHLRRDQAFLGDGRLAPESEATDLTLSAKGHKEQKLSVDRAPEIPKPAPVMTPPAAPTLPAPASAGEATKGLPPVREKAVAEDAGVATPYFRPGGVFKDSAMGPSDDRDDKETHRPPVVGVTAGDALGRKEIAEKRRDENERVAQAKEPAKTGPPEAKPAAPPKAPAGDEPAPYAQKIIIRSGEVEFEVDSFDDAVAVVQKLVAATKGGYVATTNSDKLANGKVRGSVVVRVPPGQLDGLVLGLRKELGKAGELKGQRIGSQDITKQYTDLDSRLRAARTMEKRLLKIIQEGKGEIKDLVAAEKELGVWNTKIEEIEGELKYYQNQVALSTLTINLVEKEIRVAAAVKERERVQAGVEVDDVEKAMRELLKAVGEAHGRVTRSEMKQVGARQFNAQLEFEVAPDKAGPVRDRLKQLGHVARLDIDRTQTAENGAQLPKDGKVERGETRFFVSLYNLANVQPRETVTLKLAAPDVAAAYRAVRKALEKAIDEGKARVTGADLNEQDRQNVSAHLEFDVRWTEDAAVQAALAAAGETLSRQVTRAPEGENVTDKKILYKVELVPAATIEPRETIVLAVEVRDVENGVTGVTSQVKEAQGRVVKTDVAKDRSGRTTARVVYDVPLAVAPAVVARIKELAVTEVRVQQTTRNPQAPEGKLALARIEVTLATPDVLVPHDEGLAEQIRHGVSLSLRGLSVSVSFLIVGVLFVLPWVLLIAAVVWLGRRLWRPAPAAVVVTPAPPAATP